MTWRTSKVASEARAGVQAVWNAGRAVSEKSVGCRIEWMSGMVWTFRSTARRPPGWEGSAEVPHD
jgi:hypothetical protein